MEVDTKAELVGKGTFDDYLSSKESSAWVRLCGVSSCGHGLDTAGEGILILSSGLRKEKSIAQDHRREKRCHR